MWLSVAAAIAFFVFGEAPDARRSPLRMVSNDRLKIGVPLSPVFPLFPNCGKTGEDDDSRFFTFYKM